MSISTRISLSAGLLLSVAGSPVLADLTTDEAWGSLKAQIAALGLTLSAEETREGDALRIGTLALTADLPGQAGSLSIELPGMLFEPLGDGSVGVSLPEQSRFYFGGEIAGEGSLSAVVDFITSDYRWVMSGAPDRVVSTGSAASTRMELAELTLNGVKVEDASGSMSVLDSRYQTTSVFEDGMINLDGSTFYGSQEVAYDFEITEDGSVFGVSSKGFAEAMEMSHSISMPADGLDLTNLHKHLRNGVKMAVSGTIASYGTEEQTMMDGSLLTQQKSDLVDYVLSATVDERGLSFSGESGAFTGSGQMAPLPFPFALAGSSVAMQLGFPLLSSDASQDAMMRLDIQGLTANEEIWAMVDPGAQLPRDPMALGIDLSGQVMVLHDLLDFAAMEALGAGETPFLPVSATLKDLLLSAVGTKLTGNGAVTFDATDTETIPGMPRPEGTLDLQMIGVNGLIDRLVELGLVPEDQAMGTRLMINMIAVPDAGEDALKSNIEFNSEGHLIANGQRLK